MQPGELRPSGQRAGRGRRARARAHELFLRPGGRRPRGCAGRRAAAILSPLNARLDGVHFMFKSDRVDPGASPRPDEREASDAAPGDERPVDVGPATDADADDVEAPPSAPAAAEVDYRDRWLRAEAEIQNVRRRAQRDLDEQTRAVEERMLLE